MLSNKIQAWGRGPGAEEGRVSSMGHEWALKRGAQKHFLWFYWSTEEQRGGGAYCKVLPVSLCEQWGGVKFTLPELSSPLLSSFSLPPPSPLLFLYSSEGTQAYAHASQARAQPLSHLSQSVPLVSLSPPSAF